MKHKRPRNPDEDPQRRRQGDEVPPEDRWGDFDTKTRLVEKFLSEGHKVKVTIMFRGRESAHPELGKKILDRIVSVSTTSRKWSRPPSSTAAT